MLAYDYGSDRTSCQDLVVPMPVFRVRCVLLSGQIKTAECGLYRCEHATPLKGKCPLLDLWSKLSPLGTILASVVQPNAICLRRVLRVKVERCR